MSTSEHPSTFRFSLDGVPPTQRREVVREVSGRAIANLDITPKTEVPEMAVEIRVLPGVSFVDACVSPHLASTYDLSRGDDDFTLLWSTSPARGWVRQLGKTAPADGAAALLSCMDRMDFETDEAFSHISLKLQRRVLSPLLPDAEAMLMRPIPAANEALRLLNSYLASYRSFHEASTAGLQHSVATHIADLVALAIGTNRDAAELASRRGLRAARLDAAKHRVRAHLTSPALSVNTVAAALGLSPRSVRRLFEDEGTTFAHYVLRERLALAHRCLGLPALARRTVTEIAHDCGFSHLSYFTNSFRQVYGQTPSEARRHALTARPF
jgi:AraC-like DNA-binding protein